MEGLGALLRGALPFCPAAVVLVATFTRSKTVGAYVQLGSIQEREEVRERMKAEAKAAADAGAQSPNSKIAERRLWDKLAFTVGVMNVIAHGTGGWANESLVVKSAACLPRGAAKQAFSKKKQT